MRSEPQVEQAQEMGQDARCNEECTRRASSRLRASNSLRYRTMYSNVTIFGNDGGARILGPSREFYKQAKTRQDCGDSLAETKTDLPFKYEQLNVAVTSPS